MGVTTGSLKLGNVWKVIREVDLEAIRREALAPFDLVILGEPAPGRADPRRAQPGGRGVAAPLHPRQPAGRRPDDPERRDRGHRTGAALRRSRQHAPLSRRSTRSRTRSRCSTATTRPQAADAGRGRDRRRAPRRRSPRVRAPAAGVPRADLRTDHRGHRPRQRVVRVHLGLAEVVPILTAPLNLGDMIVLTKNQLLMGYRLVLAAGRDGEPKKLIGEILGMLGGGLRVPPAGAAAGRPDPGGRHRAEGGGRLRRHVGHRPGRRAVGDGRPYRLRRDAADAQPRGAAARARRRPGTSARAAAPASPRRAGAGIGCGRTSPACAAAPGPRRTAAGAPPPLPPPLPPPAVALIARLPRFARVSGPESGVQGPARQGVHVPKPDTIIGFGNAHDHPPHPCRVDP